MKKMDRRETVRVVRCAVNVVEADDASDRSAKPRARRLSNYGEQLRKSADAA